MTVCGIVTKVKKTTVIVKTQRPASCEGCANAGICNKQDLEIEAANTLSADKGDLVEIELPEDRKALFLLGYIFLIPTMLFVLAAWLYTLTPAAALAAVPGLIAYGAGLKFLNKTHKTTNYTVQILTPAGDRQK